MEGLNLEPHGLGGIKQCDSTRWNRFENHQGWPTYFSSSQNEMGYGRALPLSCLDVDNGLAQACQGPGYRQGLAGLLTTGMTETLGWGPVASEADAQRGSQGLEWSLSGVLDFQLMLPQTSPPLEALFNLFILETAMLLL